MNESIRFVAAILVAIAVGCEQPHEFGSMQEVWDHIRTEWRKAAYLSNWDLQPLDSMRKIETTCSGHTFTVLYFDMSQNGSLYIVEHLPKGTLRVVGQAPYHRRSGPPMGPQLSSIR